MRFCAIMLFAMSGAVFAQSPHELEDERILVGTVESITYQREFGNQLGDSPIFLGSCGTETLEISGVEVLGGSSLSATIRTVNRLGEFCQSNLRIQLFPGRVLMSVVGEEDRLSVSWYSYITLNDRGMEMIAWTQELDDRFGGVVAKELCTFVEEPDEPCFEVNLEHFSELFLN